MATEELIERIRRAVSPCLRAQLEAAGLAPSHVRADDLDRLPLLDRRKLDLDVLDDPVGYLRFADAPSPVRLGTSDDDGITVVLSWTADDLERLARRGAEMLRLAGVGPRSRVANTLEGGLTTPGSLILGDALESLGALDIPLGVAHDERTARGGRDLLERTGADVLVTDARTGTGLIECLHQERPGALRRILWCGEAPPPVESGVEVRRWVSLPEISVFAAIECARGTLHLDPALRAENVGERLVVSATEGDAPLVRFVSGLRSRVVARPCACGYGGAILLPDGPV